MNLCEDQDTFLFVSVSSEPRPALSMQQEPRIYWLNYEIQLPHPSPPPIFLKKMMCLSQHLTVVRMKSLPGFILEYSIMFKLYYKVLRSKDHSLL